MLGVVLTIAGEWWFRRKEEQQEIKSVRLIIRLEIDMNIEALKKFWVESLILPASLPDENEVVRYAQKLINTRFPRFERKAIESQMHLLAKSLTEQQIIDVLKVYADLGKVEELRDKLDEKREDIKPIVELGNPEIVGTITGVEFCSLAQVVWPQIKDAVALLVVNGNPIKKQ